MRKILKDPLMHFLALGLGLFVPASYLIGTAASMWMIERVAGFWA